MADISSFLGQATAMTHSSHLLAAFRSDESPSKLPCLVVITPHKALWSVKFSSPEMNVMLHPSWEPSAGFVELKCPIFIYPSDYQVTQRPKKHQQKLSYLNTLVAMAAKFSEWKGGTSMVPGMCDFQFCLCLSYSQCGDPRNKCNSYVYIKS